MCFSTLVFILYNIFLKTLKELFHSLFDEIWQFMAQWPSILDTFNSTSKRFPIYAVSCWISRLDVNLPWWIALYEGKLDTLHAQYIEYWLYYYSIHWILSVHNVMMYYDTLRIYKQFLKIFIHFTLIVFLYLCPSLASSHWENNSC